MKNILEMRNNLIKNKQLEELKNKKCVVIYIYIYIYNVIKLTINILII